MYVNAPLHSTFNAPGGLKVLDPLALELMIIVRHHVDVGN